MCQLGVLTMCLGGGDATRGPDFDGHPRQLERGDRWADTETKQKIFDANGFTWPQVQKFKGWPPVLDRDFSTAYQKSRRQLETLYRNIPADVHHKVDDLEGLTQTMILPRFANKGGIYGGFKLVKAPEQLWKDLQANYHAERDSARMELFADSHLVKAIGEENIPRLIDNQRQAELNGRVTEQLRPILEDWSGVQLEATSTYGVRVYPNGSTLFMHVDTPETHVVSAIFHVDHDLDEPWPLEIEDHDGAVHAVSIEPGYMVLYESATQFHSRLTPMRGRHYGSVFVHYRPVGWSWGKDDIVPAVVPAGMVEPAAHPDEGLPPFEVYRRQYYKKRGLGLLDFAGNDYLALPVQNAKMMTEIVPHQEL